MKNLDKRRKSSLLLMLFMALAMSIVGCQSIPRDGNNLEQGTAAEPRGRQGQRDGRASDSAITRNLELLDTIEEALEQGSLSRARRAINNVDIEQLRDEDVYRFRIATLEYYRLSGRINQAENYIEATNLSFLEGVPRFDQSRFFILYAKILEDKGDIRSAARLLILADERLTAQQSRDNQAEILRLLFQMSIQDLLQEAKLSPDLYFRGWYDFVLLRYIDENLGRVSARDFWLESYPRHPGARYLDALYAARSSTEAIAVQGNTEDILRVTFMLPFESSSFSFIADAIVTGFQEMAAQNGIIAQTLSLDTSDAFSMAELYERAVALGSDLVIGPLRREKLEELASSYRSMPVPVIGLSRLEAGGSRRLRSPDNLYTYSLVVEDMVDFAAEMAQDRQCEKMFVIAEDESSTALRGLEHFSNIWQERGGDLLGADIIIANASVSQWISSLLSVTNQEVDASKEVFRDYLLRFTATGLSQDKIDTLIEGRLTEDPLPRILDYIEPSFLVSPTEVERLTQKFYGEKPSWLQLNETKNELVDSLDLPEGTDLPLSPDSFDIGDSDEPDDSPPTRQEIRELMDNFYADIQNSFDRADIDCIFLSMDSIKAAQVRSFLSFYLANDIPLFGTFFLFNRGFSRNLYRDLEAITYGEMPGILENPTSFEDDRTFTKRFYLLGRDLLLISNRVRSISLRGSGGRRSSRNSEQQLDNNNLYIIGEAGMLYLDDEENRFRIIPREVYFRAGYPRSATGRSIFR